MNAKAKEYIEVLEMKPHAEGGYYKENYRHPMEIDGAYLDVVGKRSISTSIYFLLNGGELSHLHQLKSDEMWYFHDGQPLTIVLINELGFNKVSLGLNLKVGERPQVLVPAGTIFGSYNDSEEGFSLVGCMVSFGFEFEDFTLIQGQDLLIRFPEEATLINRLCLI